MKIKYIMLLNISENFEGNVNFEKKGDEICLDMF